MQYLQRLAQRSELRVTLCWLRESKMIRSNELLNAKCKWETRTLLFGEKRRKKFVVFTFSAKISFDDVSFSYPKRKEVPVLRNISLKFHAGESVAICGASGLEKNLLFLFSLSWLNCKAVAKAPCSNCSLATTSVMVEESLLEGRMFAS